MQKRTNQQIKNIVVQVQREFYSNFTEALWHKKGKNYPTSEEENH